MAQRIYLETAAIVKLQQMISDEMHATENVIERYSESDDYPTQSLQFDLETLHAIDHALKHAQKGN